MYSWRVLPTPVTHIGLVLSAEVTYKTKTFCLVKTPTDAIRIAGFLNAAAGVEAALPAVPSATGIGASVDVNVEAGTM